MGQPGRRPVPEPTDAEEAFRAAAFLSHTLWRLDPKDVDPGLASLLEGIGNYADRFRPRHD
jgi:hypothetical protein